MANLTRAYLRYIKIVEDKVMHHHLSELKHPQWGSIVGYENHIRIAVLKDEIVELKSRLESTETGYLIPTISTLQQRVREMEDKEKVDVEERIERWETEITGSSTENGNKKYPDELRGPGPDEEK